MEFFAAYRADGVMGWVGSGSPGTIAAMIPPDGFRVIACSQASFEAGAATIAEVRAALAADVEAERAARMAAGADAAACDAAAAALQAGIDAATTIAALLAIDLGQGWP